DEAELDKLVRLTLRREHREQGVEIDLTKPQLEMIIRNLRGLTRRQAEQVVREAICEDRRFDADDVAAMLSAKRRILSEGGLLDFVEAPADLSEIGGLNHLKNWLTRRA